MNHSEAPSQASDHYQSARRLPFLDEFSERDREALEKAAEELDDRQRQANDRRRVHALEAADQYRTLLLNYPLKARLREATVRERRAFLDARQPPEGLALDEEKARETARRRIDELLNELIALLDIFVGSDQFHLDRFFLGYILCCAYHSQNLSFFIGDHFSPGMHYFFNPVGCNDPVKEVIEVLGLQSVFNVCFHVGFVIGVHK